VVKKFRRYVAAAAAIVVIAGVSWFGLKQHRRHQYQIPCKEHDAAFARQLESIKQQAHEQLKVGTKKADVSRFFAEHGLPLGSTPGSESEAVGMLQTAACAREHCGDGVIIEVRVKVDPAAP
jgi:hypothetical protein